MTDTRSVLALILSVMILQLAGGLTGILTPLGLERLGVDASLIGFVAAMNAAGFMLGAWTSPRALALVGNIRLFAAGAGLSAAGILSLALIQEAPFWALIRVLQGVSFAYMFTSIESWLGEAVPARSRGNVMGVYHTAAKLSLIVGPFFLAGLSPLDSRSYIWAGLFLALALVPTCLTTLKEPPPPDRKAMPLGQLFTIAPAAVVGVVGAGLVNTGTLALLPVYFEKFDLAGGGTAAAAIAIAIVVFPCPGAPARICSLPSASHAGHSQRTGSGVRSLPHVNTTPSGSALSSRSEASMPALTASAPANWCRSLKSVAL
ncbi:MAG: hypothetical protein B7Z22_10080, partial [Hyphomonas sp. 32-62-5]